MKLQCTIGESEEILEQRLHLSSVKVLSTEELCEGIYCEVLIIFEVFLSYFVLQFQNIFFFIYVSKTFMIQLYIYVSELIINCFYLT